MGDMTRWTYSNIVNSAGWSVTVSNTATNVNIINSAGWVTTTSAQLLAGVAAVGSVGVLGTVPVSQSGTWRVILATSENLIGTMNTIAIGAGQTTSIVNSAGWVVTASAQLLAGVAAVGSVSILNAVNVLNTAGISELRPATSSTSNVVGTNGSVTLLASNVNRRGAIIYNDVAPGTSLYLKLGATATTASFSIRIYGEECYELSYPPYTGVIDGIWSTSAGVARITEITA